MWFKQLLLIGLTWLYCLTSATAAPGDNVALTSNGGTAAMSSLYATKWPASICIDGVTAEASNRMCHTAANGGPNAWLDITLAAEVPIDSIVIYNRTACCTFRILDIYVLVSTSPFPNGNDAASLAAARAQADFEFQINADVPVTTIPVSHVTGKYVRFQKADGTSAMNLYEVQVFEDYGWVDLSMSKNVSNVEPSIGDVITFTLSVSNTGPDMATDVLVTDLVPAGFDVISNISDSGTDDGSGLISWIIPTLGSGATQSLTFDATVIAP